VKRTAEELGRAFPGTPVLLSSGDKLVLEVPDGPALVLATPQAEPKAPSGYAAAVILDADRSLGRADLRVEEESLRRWLAVVSLVRPASGGGTALIVGDPAERAVQALLRLDAAGFAERELDERESAGFPPAVKLVALDGTEPVLMAAKAALELPSDVQALGPFPRSELDGSPMLEQSTGEPLFQLTLRCPPATGSELVAAVKALLATRSARKLPGVLRCQVDPQTI
jgi:primosomal protein N' (replication factor Y)